MEKQSNITKFFELVTYKNAERHKNNLYGETKRHYGKREL